MKRFSIAVILAVATFVAGGCESSSNPTSPTIAGPDPRQTFTLSGVVTEMTLSGVTPVDGALVQETRSQLGATTDKDGHYRIPGLSAGSGAVRIVKEGYIISTSNVDISADAQLDVRIQLIAAYILSGVVFEITSSGRVAVAGVQLACDSCGSPADHTFISTDAGGRYSFAGLMNGMHQLQVWKLGYALADPAGTHGSRVEYINTTVDGDTQFDIEVVRR